MFKRIMAGLFVIAIVGSLTAFRISAGRFPWSAPPDPLANLYASDDHGYTFQFSANHAQVSAGESVVLSWVAPTDSRCTLFEGSLRTKLRGLKYDAIEIGAYAFTPVTTATYTLQCTPKGGTSADTRAKEVTVVVQ